MTLLLQLLAILRALHWSHWTLHWKVKGDPFYGDHLMYQRLYEAVVEEINGERGEWREVAAEGS